MTCSVPDEMPAELAPLMLSCFNSDPALRPSAVELVERLLHIPAVPLGPAASSGSFFGVPSGGLASPVAGRGGSSLTPAGSSAGRLVASILGSVSRKNSIERRLSLERKRSSTGAALAVPPSPSGGAPSTDGGASRRQGSLASVMEDGAVAAATATAGAEGDAEPSAFAAAPPPAQPSSDSSSLSPSQAASLSPAPSLSFASPFRSMQRQPSEQPQPPASSEGE